jgi:hypothetical protein
MRAFLHVSMLACKNNRAWTAPSKTKTLDVRGFTQGDAGVLFPDKRNPLVYQHLKERLSELSVLNGRILHTRFV